MAPKGSPVRSSFKLTVNPTPSSVAPDLGETRKSAAVKTPSRSCFSHPDPSHPITEPDVVIKSDDCVSTAGSHGTANTGEPRITRIDTRDQDDRYFDVEAIKSCKLNSRGIVLLQVKWKDYEDPSDITWEPERVLRSDVPHILNAYFEDCGGRDKVLNNLRQKWAIEKGTARAKSRVSKSRV